MCKLLAMMKMTKHDAKILKMYQNLVLKNLICDCELKMFLIDKAIAGIMVMALGETFLDNEVGHLSASKIYTEYF